MRITLNTTLHRVLGAAVIAIVVAGCASGGKKTGGNTQFDFGPLGDTEISLNGPKSDYQAMEDKLLAFANTAQEADGAMTVTVAWDEPIAVDGTEWNQLHKLVQNADPGEITDGSPSGNTNEMLGSAGPGRPWAANPLLIWL